MAKLRARKPVPKASSPAPEEDKSKTKRSTASSDPDLEPNFFVVAAMFLVFTLVVGTFLYYKVDNRTPPGPFASWVNEQYPWIDSALNRPRLKVPFGAQAQDVTGILSLTEEELKAYDGTDTEKPIYLGIDGTIFDVSASPSFYGPGGHYHHFVGKDATRAWVTECWDEPEQFTWRMEGVESMFMPKWMDEMLQKAAGGDYEGSDMAGIGAMPKEMIANMAKKTIEKFGTVTDKEIAKRRVEDEKEAKEKVEETLRHWVKFFEGNEKYKKVGVVVRDEGRPEPPVPCEAAMKKRPMKGGRLESMMAGLGPMMGGAGAAAGGAAEAGMPAAVKEKLEAAKRKAEQAKDKVKEAVVGGDEEEEDLVHEEL